MSFDLICNIHYIIALIALVWMIWRYRDNSFLLLVLLMAFEGSLVYLISNITAQYMRIIFVIWVSYLMSKEKILEKLSNKMLSVLGSFIFFSAYFIWVCLYIHDDSVLMTFSQYSKYYVPFGVLLLMDAYYRKNLNNIIYFNKFFGEVILIQILVATVTYILLGFHHWEGMVGTFGPIDGGNHATTFPLVALAWVLVNSNMDIKGAKSWLFMFGLLMIGVAAGKRAIIVLYPFFYVLFSILVAQKRYARGMLLTIMLAPVFLYVGLRLTPSLNPEHKVWGRFDIEYALNYGKDYSIGQENIRGERHEGDGRVGAVVLVFNRIMDVEQYSNKTWFGYGLTRLYTSRDDAWYYDRTRNFGINHSGSITGGVRMLLAIGLVGFLLFMFYYFLYFSHIYYKRLRYALYGMVMFDFIFYGSTIILEPIIAITLIFVMYYSRIQYTPSGRYVGQKHPYFQ